MIKKIRRIGNSSGIIIPRVFLEQLGSPTEVDVSPTEEGIIIRPIAGRITRGKPRDEDETEGLLRLASAKIEKNIKTGKVRWTGKREMERKISL